MSTRKNISHRNVYLLYAACFLLLITFRVLLPIAVNIKPAVKEVSSVPDGEKENASERVLLEKELSSFNNFVAAFNEAVTSVTHLTAYSNSYKASHYKAVMLQPPKASHFC